MAPLPGPLSRTGVSLPEPADNTCITRRGPCELGGERVDLGPVIDLTAKEESELIARVFRAECAHLRSFEQIP